MIDINKLTIGQIKEIRSLLTCEELTCEKNKINGAWILGESYLVRTVTLYLVGKLILITNKELMFDNASWVADTGRFHTALKTGALTEVEPFIDPVGLNRESIIDWTLWRHTLPTEQK